MSQPLARRQRPKRFTDVVGQETAVRVLTKSLASGQLHHGYLFCGTRGVGKTTLARLLAKALNCEKGISPEPCGACGACLAIDAGAFVDLIEIDAASHTGVEHMRAILDGVSYAPVRGRAKIYLIDEAHMLSRSAFNAMLKTLEEPPPHVKFILATTEAQKIPATIVSRCLVLNLKRVPAADLSRHLGQVLSREGIPACDKALSMLAQAADGSIRDALSLLEMALALSEGRLDEGAAAEALGSAPKADIERLALAIAQENLPEVLEIASSFEERGVDWDLLLSEIAHLFHEVAMAQFGVFLRHEAKDALEILAKSLSPEAAQLGYEIALKGREELSWAPRPLVAARMAFLRMMAFFPAIALGGKSHASTPRQEAAPSAPVSAPERQKKEKALPDARWWQENLSSLGLEGRAAMLARHLGLLEAQEGKLIFALGEGGKAYAAPEVQGRLEEALCRRLGRKVQVVLQRSREAAPLPEEDERKRLLRDEPLLRHICEELGGGIQDIRFKGKN